MNISRFRRVVRAVLFSAGPCATVACSSNETEMPERAACIDLAASNRYGALTLSPGVDGIVLATRGRTESASTSPATTPPAPQRIAALGAPCATASDRDACARRVDELLAAPTSEGWRVPGRNTNCGECDADTQLDLGVITAGNEVRLATLADVVRAATPVETREEAIALFMLQGNSVDCDTNNVRRDADGWTFKSTSSYCDGEVVEYFRKVVAASGAVVDAGRNVVEEGDNSCIEGRRPANLVSTGVSWLASLPACFAEIAHMEAAAVLAFEDLEVQLRALAAPPALLARAVRAKEDEVRHAAITARLARRFGATPKTPRVAPTLAAQPRAPMLRLALENAVEGCLREAYGALVAAFQAAHATDPEVREAFLEIALDEAEHAELSFAIDGWLASLLSAEERRCVEAAKARSFLDLHAVCNAEPAAEVRSVAGVPSAAAARALLAQLAWATDAAA